jgi:hypothetical protein
MNLPSIILLPIGVPLVGPREVGPTVPPWVDVSWTDNGDQLNDPQS